MMRTGLASLLIAVGVSACSAFSDPPTIDGTVPVPDGTRATLTSVFDGDSIEVEIEGGTEEVRLIGVNAPEGDECFGERARNALIGYLDGEDIDLVGGSDSDTDQYGRLLRYVYVGGENINARMLAEGNAVTLQGNHRSNEAFVEIGSLAAETATGMWAPDACGPLAAPGMSIVEVASNPPGPDDERLNDENVTIANRGEAVVNLAGWTLRDESSQNRYVFGAVTLTPGDGVTVKTGCGTDRPGTLHWCSDRPVWSNTGDTVMLQDTSGNMVDRWTYQ
jgi:micrococcal nuclease